MTQYVNVIILNESTLVELPKDIYLDNVHFLTLYCIMFVAFPF